MKNVAMLVFNGDLLGYRFKDATTIYDIELDLVRKLGFKLDEVKKKITLKDVNGLLLSESEEKTNILAQNITENVDFSRDLIVKVLNAEARALIETAPKPVVAKPTPPKPKAPKKVKPLEFKNGLAIIIVGFEGSHGEYNTIKSTTECYLMFNTKTAISKVCAITGIPLDKKSTLAKYERGNKAHKVILDDNMFYVLTQNVDCNFYVAREGIVLSDENYYDGSRVNVRLIPPNFEATLKEEYKYASIGTTADGEPLQDYIKNLKGAFESGYYTYLDHVLLSDVRRM
jgi:hypothetical protein